MSELTCNEISELMLPIEANVVASIYSDPNLIHDLDIGKELFQSNIWKCYYLVAEKIVKSGGQSLDEITIETFLNLEPNHKLRDIFYSFGGYKKISMAIDIVDSSNAKFWSEELRKYSGIYEYIKNCTITKDMFNNKLHNLSADDVYDYITAKTSNCFIGLDSNVCVPKELTSGIYDMIDHCDKGLQQGMPIPSDILNSEIKGLQLGQILGIAGLSGSGKTTTVIELILSTIWDNGESAVIFLNEQDLKKMQQQMITWIINNKLQPSHELSSGRWLSGHFSDSEKTLILTATKMLEEKITDNKIIICELLRYNCKSVCRMIKKYASLGIKYFVLDTFKVSTDAKTDQQWQSFMADAVELDNLIKPASLNVSLVLTMQLEKGKAAVSRYLNESNLGISKNIKDVFSVLLLMRRLYNDEYPERKNALSVVKPIPNSNSTQEVTLSPHKQYCIIFIDKNRNGVSNQFQIVSEQDLGKLKYKEIGICNVPFGT